MLHIRNISFKVAERYLLQHINADFKPGALTALMGSNGAGKSTLLKSVSGEIKPTEGHIYWNGTDLRDWNLNHLARTRAVLRQQYQMQLPFVVHEVIAMGRYPHFKSKLTLACKSVIDEVAAYTGVQHLMKRNYLTLSGGEQQRVQLARVLAQVWDAPAEQKLILLDEPVSALDIQYQHQLLALVNALTTNNFTVIAVLHDLNLAMQYAHEVLLLKQGRIVEFAPKEVALNAQHIHETFGVAASLHQTSGYPHPFITVNTAQQPKFQHIANF